MYKRHITGKEGEFIASKYLQSLGYKLIERNFYCREGEIDIIAKDKNEFVFVEVKSRTNIKYGQPVDGIDKNKLRCIKKAIKYYMYLHKLENCYIRIDVIEVKYKENKIYLNHIKQAIQ